MGHLTHLILMSKWASGCVVHAETNQTARCQTYVYFPIKKKAEKANSQCMINKLRKRARTRRLRTRAKGGETGLLTHTQMKWFHPLTENTIELCLWELERSTAHPGETVRCRDTAGPHSRLDLVLYCHRHSVGPQIKQRQDPVWLLGKIVLQQILCPWASVI